MLLRTSGGDVCLPDPATIMIDRADGGQLVVYPRRRVWDRTALTAAELVAWNALVAAVGRAMLEHLPQLDGGCLNYWDAGNWALNDAAAPEGRKAGRDHRVLHQHVIGRSPESRDLDWRWGESPFFPAYADRFAWSVGKRPVTADEAAAIVAGVRELLVAVYDVVADAIEPEERCAGCRYPGPGAFLDAERRCPRCAEDGSTPQGAGGV